MRHYPFPAVLMRIQAPRQWYTIVREQIRMEERSASRQTDASLTIIRLNRIGDQIITVTTRTKILNLFALKTCYLGHSR